MARPPKFDAATIAAAARAVVAERGPQEATIATIAERLGGPTGSIYHRYRSRAHLLATVWLDAAQAFQDGFLAHVDHGDVPELIGLTFRFCREQPLAARVLLLHRIGDFEQPGWPRELIERAAALEAQLQHALSQLAERLLGSNDAISIRRVGLAICELPLAGVRRPLERGEPIPDHVQADITSAAQALLSRGVARGGSER